VNLADGVPSRQIIEALFLWAQAEPERAAVADFDCQLSYGDLADAIAAAANRLRRHGVAVGDRVVVAAPNSVRELVAHLAAIAVGGVAVPIGAVSDERLAFIVADSTARVVVTNTPGDPRRAVLGGGIVVLGLDDLATADVQPAQSSLSAAELLAPDLRRPEQLACLMYTTGSTGEPKGVMLSHRGLGAALAHIIEYVGFSKDDREAVVLPLSHSFGLGEAYCTLITGGFLWINDGLRPMKAVFGGFRDHRITALSTTPSMLRLLLGVYRTPFLASMRDLRRMIVNSEPLPPEQTADLLTLFPDADIVSYYGLTEASRSTFLRPRQEPSWRYRSAGRPAPRVEVAIHDEADVSVGRQTEGEVCIRGPHLAAGYWRRPEEQAAAFRDGWLHTGDLGVLDGDGYLTITGRLKDQINVGGLKVSASDIERVIRNHPMTADVAVLGMPDPDGLRGEVVCAVIVPRGAALAPRDVFAFCASRLEAAAQPRHVVLVDRIPRAETGKVLKGELRQLLARANAGISS
jgi:acyl-CoA synthetase (AMP-forming)/AMP-acid ligase II